MEQLPPTKNNNRKTETQESNLPHQRQTTSQNKCYSNLVQQRQEKHRTKPTIEKLAPTETDQAKEKHNKANLPPKKKDNENDNKHNEATFPNRKTQ